MATTSFAISSSRIDRIKEEVFAYFHCESCGINQQSGENCSRSGFERLTNDALVTMAYSLFGLHSLITLVYVVRMSDLKVCCGMIRKRLRGLTRGTSVTTMSQMASDGMAEIKKILSFNSSLSSPMHISLSLSLSLSPFFP